MLTLSVHFPLPVLPHVLVGPLTTAEDGGLCLPLIVIFVPLLLMTEIFLLLARHQPIRPIQLDYLLLMTVLQGRPLPSVIQMFDLLNLRMRLVALRHL